MSVQMQTFQCITQIQFAVTDLFVGMVETGLLVTVCLTAVTDARDAGIQLPALPVLWRTKSSSTMYLNVFSDETFFHSEASCGSIPTTNLKKNNNISFEKENVHKSGRFLPGRQFIPHSAVSVVLNKIILHQKLYLYVILDFDSAIGNVHYNTNNIIIIILNGVTCRFGDDRRVSFLYFTTSSAEMELCSD